MNSFSYKEIFRFNDSFSSFRCGFECGLKCIYAIVLHLVIISRDEEDSAKLQQILEAVKALTTSNDKIQKDVETIKSSQALHLERFDAVENRVEDINQKLIIKENVDRASNILIFGMTEKVNPEHTLF